MNMSYWYIATPYAKYVHGLDAAHRLACFITGELARSGFPVFSPIAHGQGLADFGGIAPTDHDVWMTINGPLMAAAHGLVVVTAESWGESRGIAAEIEAFERARKPIIYGAPTPIATLVEAMRGGA